VAAAAHGLIAGPVRVMPADNRLLVYQRV